ncbi:tail fiber domain-containing protein [Soonwooa sp.]|uniref:tail fiber domain-containing protein n=1 Tax=Soonwooa sp. TaxID=1938592 RepID=UPI00262C0568|nr:tail fiber domain-containing protein [Soonwooa sp.]
MKKLFTSLAICLIGLAYAQSPNMMSYQAVVRKADNTLVANKPIGMKVSILKGSETGTMIYSEAVSNPTTNANGLVSVKIGSGAAILGSFKTIDWASDLYFLKTEIDPLGGSNYSIVGTSQLLSVPYSEFSNGINASNNGGTGLQGKSSTGLWMGLYEGGEYRGYLGSYAGANEDVDFGTGTSNEEGSVHLTIKAQPKLTISKVGFVGIDNTAPSYKFQVDGITGGFQTSGIRIQNATADKGWSFYPSATGNMIIGNTTNLGEFNGVTGAYTSLSDERLKTNFQALDSVLKSVSNLKLLRYEYKNNNPTHRKDIGVVAQDLQKYFPELVSVNSTNEGNIAEQNQMFVNYSGLGVVALKAIQEQQEIIKNLEARIKQLESKK